MIRFTFGILSLLILLNACNLTDASSGKENFIPDPTRSSISTDAFEVIYSLNLPTDIARIFEETGTGFNPDLLLPLDRIPFYENSDQMALLIGALGVDLSYCKLFERVLESTDSYKHIELLANKLELPGEIFEKSSSDLEQYINKPDSLTVLINQVYSDVDSYFMENGQESLASLSLFGGWLEAMYIGVKIYQDKSILEMGDRILQQKYALNNLTGLLANYQESLVVRRYMHPLNKLKDAYEDVDIRYSQAGFIMNQEERTIHASVSKINYEPETLENICQIIIRLREEIIE
ncbi:MAG: hypothetical protein ABFS38_00640 [Bacteroidota bacterium]